MSGRITSSFGGDLLLSLALMFEKEVVLHG